MKRGISLAGVTAVAMLALFCGSASAATIVVNVTNDAPDGGFDDTGCTLREAVQSANTNAPGANCNADTAGADTIVLDAGLTYKLTNHAAPESANVSGDLDITGGGGTTIRSTGPGLATIDADSTLIPGDDTVRGRAVDILAGAGAVTLQRVRIINGAEADVNPGGGGGGIRTRAPLTLIDSEVSGNTAGFAGNPQSGGGGILVEQGGALTMTGSTVAGNSVLGGGSVSVAQGGGITFNSIGFSMTATNSTISGNVADSVATATEAFGGGIVYASGASMALTNVTINRNSATGPSTDVHSGGIFIAFGANNATIRGSILAGNQAKFQLDCGQQTASNDLVNVSNPNLAPLANFGGPTPTQLPNPGSPAIDHGGVCPATDQRGLFRAPAAPCDAGAVEVGAPATLPPPPDPGGGGLPGDTAAPDTQITAGPASKSKKRKASFTFTSTEANSTFQCKLDDAAFAACSSPLEMKVEKGKHSFEVKATDAAGNVDPTPATLDWKVKKKR